MRKTIILLVVFVMGIVCLSGCSTFKKKKGINELEAEISHLNRKLAGFEKEKNAEMERLRAENQRLADTKGREVSDLEKAKKELEQRLKEEIGNYKAKLEMTERGLVITFLSEIFFDSGKDQIRTDGEKALAEVAQVLNANIPDSLVAIEGHTDNVPIKHSGWKSNWELSSARALAVVHYFIDQCKIKPERLSAVGYGEYKPVLSNETPEGRQKNRRVEIVILPPEVKKIKAKD
ncbi:MAG: OmpA family protein [Candidatus Omnitrophota bacterium]